MPRGFLLILRTGLVGEAEDFHFYWGMIAIKPSPLAPSIDLLVFSLSLGR